MDTHIADRPGDPGYRHRRGLCPIRWTALQQRTALEASGRSVTVVNG